MIIIRIKMADKVTLLTHLKGAKARLELRRGKILNHVVEQTAKIEKELKAANEYMALIYVLPLHRLRHSSTMKGLSNPWTSFTTSSKSSSKELTHYFIQKKLQMTCSSHFIPCYMSPRSWILRNSTFLEIGFFKNMERYF